MAEQNRNSGPLATIVLIVVLALAGWFGFVYEIPKKAPEPAETAAEAPAPVAPETASATAPSGATEQPDGAAASAESAAPGTEAAAETASASSSDAASGATGQAAQTGTAPSPAGAESAAMPAEASPAAENPSAETAATSAAASTAAASEETASAETTTLAGPTFDVVRVEPSGETVAAGLAEPKATVELLDGAQPIARTEANERGEWTVLLDKPLAPGTHDLGIRTISPDGRTQSLSEQRVAVDVPQQPAEQPLVVLNTPEEPSRVLQAPETVTAASPAEPTQAPADPAASPATGGAEPEQPATPAAATGTETVADTSASAETPARTAAAEPSAASTEGGAAPAAETGAAPAAEAPSVAAAGEAPAAATDTPPGAGAAAPKVAVEAVEIENGRLYVAGSASTRDAVRVYVDDQPVGEAKPDENGRWILEANRDLDPGQHAVRADQVGADGQVIVRAEVDFLREPDTVALAPVVVSPGAAGGSGAAGTAVEVAMPQTQTVIIRRGDNLWRIARRLYGRGIRYTTIYAANDDQIRSPHRIYPGQVFVVPAGDLRWTN